MTMERLHIVNFFSLWDTHCIYSSEFTALSRGKQRIKQILWLGEFAQSPHHALCCLMSSGEAVTAVGCRGEAGCWCIPAVLCLCLLSCHAIALHNFPV